MGALRCEDRGAVRVLTLDNPRKRNALDHASLAELVAAFRAASGDAVRCLVLRGAGDRAFCSGFDIAALAGWRGDERPDRAVERAMEALEAVPCPTVAYLNGHAFGAGGELAVACDLRVAREDASIAMTPARLGVVYPPAGLRRFLQLVGPARTRDLFFTGRAVGAREALALGLVDRVLPAGEAEAGALALADEIASGAPLAVQGMKRILRLLGAAAERELSDAERDEVEALRRHAFESDDVREGCDAFRAKRPPRFRGR